MVVGNDTLYGNEWINYNQTYLKFEIAADGIYRIQHQTLVNAGVPVASITANQFQLFNLGQEVPLRITTSGNLGANDYIEFYANKNRAALDSFLFQNPSTQLLNPYYSLFTDTAVYYLTWNTSANGLRMQEVTNNIANPPAQESFYMHEHLETYGSRWVKKRSSGYIYDSKFDLDGFVKSLGTSTAINFATPHIYTNGAATSQLETRMVIAEDGLHELELKFNGATLVDEDFGGMTLRQYNFDIPTTDLNASGNNQLNITTSYDNKDKHGVAYYKLTYPRTFDFDNANYFRFSIAASSVAKYLEISNFDAGGNDPILYDLTNNIFINAIYDANTNLVKVLLPSSATQRDLILINPNTGIQNIDNLQAANFVDYSQTTANYVIISNSRLYNNPSGGINWVQEYADYRSSAAGGNYNAIVVDVNELYEQFSYGVKRHHASIRNFSAYVKNIWNTPDYFFLIGKGILYNQTRSAAGFQNNYAYDYVPTFSFPGSDNLAITRSNDTEPYAAVGRLAADDINEVGIYLRKVIQHETSDNVNQTIADKAWQKRIVHLGGGNSAGEQNSIKNTLNGFKNIIENNQFGGNVHSFFKTSSDPIQVAVSEQLTDLINDGVSVMTFLGHSYAGGFDVSLDEPSFYENEGRYPLILSYGCYSGQIFISGTGISSQFIFEDNKGAIAFASSVGLVSISTLGVFGREFYNQMGGESYGMGIGDIMNAAHQNTKISTGSLSRQMVLHGDPAVRLHPQPGPDYTIDAASVAFNPTTIDVQEDSFELSFDIVNLGYHHPDTSILIRITQGLPSGELINLLNDTIAAPAFRQSLHYSLPTLGNVAIGLNKIYIDIDADNVIQELPLPDAETNNSLVNNNGIAGVSVFFTSNAINPVYPQDFGIVGTQNLTLKATPTNTLADAQNYIFQIDTTTQFNSPLLQQTVINQAGGIVSWQPTLSYQDSTTYYWRASPDSTSAAGYNWRSSSFVFINNINAGWNQSHYYQFEDNNYYNVRLKANTRSIEFIDDFKDLTVENLLNLNGLDYVECFLNNNKIADYRKNNMNGSDVFIIVFDSLSLEAWGNPPGGLYGSINTHGSRTYNAFPFSAATEADRQTIITFLNDIVPENNYVVFLTIQNDAQDSYFPETWAADSINTGTSLFQLLEAQGATQVRLSETRGSVPYLFLYQKGNGAMFEEIADTVTQKITMAVPIPGSWDNGYTTSSLIGPASQWETLKWRATSPNNANTDVYSLDILGVTANGTDTLLYEGLTATDTSLAYIDAADFPYIRLKYNTLDTNYKTSAHLNYWRVLYEGIPEMAIAPNLHYEFYSDTIQQGDILDFEIAVQNISDYTTDSVLVNYTLTDANNNQLFQSERLKLLNRNDTLHTQLRISTAELNATSSLTLQVNPNNDQPELRFDNNTAIKSFFVVQDDRHPLLDVTFDGVHIMNGDIVAPQPQILIALRDENQFLALNDTSLFKIWITDPEGNQKRYFLNGSDAIFYPADNGNLSANNQARVELSPYLELDGTYQLIVQAQDRSGNASGQIDYKVSFEVIHEAMISHVLNYPNPFTTSTQFVFTLTGNQIPDDLRIQIFTVSGRLVREINKEELGDLRIGLNRTDFRWDGTDEFGDRLANGVYLYRVTATINGETMDNYYTKANPYFQNGFGKMVLMR